MYSKVILAALFAPVAFAATINLQSLLASLDFAAGTGLQTIVASVDFAAPGSSFQIHPDADNSKCLDVRGDRLDNGTAVQIFDCNGTGAQRWLIKPGETKVRLANTDFCLDAGSHPADNVPMKIWKCFDNLPAQAWFYTADLRIALTGRGLCLDLTNGITTNGNRVQTYKCTDRNTNQIWTTTRRP